MNGHVKIIHDASLHILKHTGLMVEDRALRQQLKAAGVRVEGDTVYFSSGQVNQAIANAPFQFKLFARHSRRSVNIGLDSRVHGPAFGAGGIVSSDGMVRPGMLTDYIRFVRLYHQAPGIHLNGGPIVKMADIPSHARACIQLFTTIVHSDKCLISGQKSDRQNRRVLEMLEIVFGGKNALRKKPRMLFILRPVSPLTLDRSVCRSLSLFLDYGQPFAVMPAIVPGQSGPYSVSGAIVQASAEILGVLTIAQIISHGAKVVSGLCSQTVGLPPTRPMSCSPAISLTARYNGQLTRSYRIPCMGTGLITESETVTFKTDWQGGVIPFSGTISKCRSISLNILH